jgi:hypothetical protein
MDGSSSHVQPHRVRSGDKASQASKLAHTRRAHSWAKLQKPAKNEIQNFFEIDWLYLRYACNSLTTFKIKKKQCQETEIK